MSRAARVVGLAALLLVAAKPAQKREVALLESAGAMNQVVAELGAGGRPVVLHFWATWCPECVQEMPGFLQAAQKASAAGAQVALVSVDKPDDRTTKVPAFLAKRGYEGPAYLLGVEDPGPIAQALGLSDWDGALPTTVVLRDGKVVAHHYGKLPGAKALLADVERAKAAGK